MTIGIALIGSGIFAKEEHLPAIQLVPSLDLKAVYSRSLQSAKTLSENLSSVDLYSEDSDGKSYDEVLKREDIKAVVIALPILAQPTYIKKALAAGKHVLAEKPVAKDIPTAQDLISWTSDKSNTSAHYTVAENFRYLPSFHYAASQIGQLGRILSFRVRIAFFAAEDNKYVQTSWRNKPEYQGGMILDGGVHFAAALRVLLNGGGEKMKSISAYTTQLQPHLPPTDSMHATCQLTNDSCGTFSICVGTTDKGSEYVIACEKGVVSVSMGTVTITKDGKVVDEKEFKDEGNGVKAEIKAWAESLEKGTRNEEQSPEEALRDVEIIEAALRSGGLGGAAVRLRLQ